MVAAASAAACDKAQLLAPTNSTITVSSATKVLPTGGSTQITAFVVEQAGTPVQNGTVVRFTTTLGNVSPSEVQTTNGVALTTFLAGSTSGVAQVRGISGGAKAPEANANLVEITIGAAAVNTVTIRANPGSVGPSGGTVELIATVVGYNGRALDGIGVTFTTDQGALGASSVTTNSSGEARTTLTTTQQAVVNATAGAKTSSNVTITLRSGPIVTVACVPASGTGNCAAVQASTSNNTATVVYTVTKPSGSSNLRAATIDFGDDTSQSLGNLAGGSATVTHTYNGPSSSTARPYTATVSVADVNGESAATATVVTVTPKASLTPINVKLEDSCSSTTRRCSYTATATGGGEGTANASIESYRWNFGDNSDEVTTSGNTTAHVYTVAGRYVVTVTARTPDGRAASGRTEVVVN